MAFSLNRFYQWAINTCNQANVGYSQTYRNQQTVNGITYYDCSSFVNYALIAGGASTPDYAPDNNAFTTHTEASVLLDLGWTEVSASGEYKAGDIGLSSSHTEICYKGGSGSGIFMGAHTSGVTLVNQVSIGSSSGNASYTRSFPRLFRYGDGGATGFLVSKYVIAAICGNFWKESNINPGIWESLSEGTWTDLNKGYGLGQWTNTGGDTQGRLYKLYTWMTENGYLMGSMEGQAEYIIEENVWNTSASYQQTTGYSSLSEFLQSSSTDLDALTQAWMFNWEGINNGTLSERQGYAQTVYDYLVAHENDTSITSYYSSNEYLSESQILNNSVMFFRIFGGLNSGKGLYTFLYGGVRDMLRRLIIHA